jgi:hypothetical protein
MCHRSRGIELDRMQIAFTSSVSEPSVGTGAPCFMGSRPERGIVVGAEPQQVFESKERARWAARAGRRWFRRSSVCLGSCLRRGSTSRLCVRDKAHASYEPRALGAPRDAGVGPEHRGARSDAASDDVYDARASVDGTPSCLTESSRS